MPQKQPYDFEQNLNFDRSFFRLARLNFCPYFTIEKQKFSIVKLKFLFRLSIIFVDLSELHRISNATQYQMDHYGEFYRQELKPALEDIRDRSGWIDLDWIPVKEGKKYTVLDIIYKPQLKPAEKIASAVLDKSIDEHAKRQRLSYQCAAKHKENGIFCVPWHGGKCTYCLTRGSMYAKKIVEKNHSAPQTL